MGNAGWTACNDFYFFYYSFDFFYEQTQHGKITEIVRTANILKLAYFSQHLSHPSEK